MAYQALLLSILRKKRVFWRSIQPLGRVIMRELILYLLTIGFLARIASIEYEGPLASSVRTVLWKDADQFPFSRPLNLFDWLRRPFGIYTINP